MNNFLRRSAVYLIVLMIIMSPQFNIALANHPIKLIIFHALILGSFLIIASKNPKSPIFFSIIFIMAIGTLYQEPLKGLGLGIALGAGYTAAADYRADFDRVMRWLLIGQFFATTLQFLSVSDTVHVLQMYQSDSIRQSIFDEAFGETMFLPQIRPSGIFPAATYASAYSVLLTLHLLSARNEKSWVFVLAGTHLAMLGSTAGLLLIIGSLPLALKVQPRARHLILSYLCALVLYKLLIPLRFDYNFSFGDIWVSVTSRLEANYIGGESLLQIDFLAFIGISLFLLLTASFTVFLRKLTASPRLITFSIATMMPILIHDISKSIFYWFLLGLALESLLRQVHSGLPKNVSTIRA